MRASLAVLCALAATAHAAPGPAPFIAAMKSEECGSLRWTKVTEATWFAYCVPRDIEEGSHRGFVFHHAAGAKTFDKLALFDREARHAIRGADVDSGVTVAIKGNALTVSSNGYSGEVTVEVWDIAAFPPRLTKATHGGGSAWSHATAPLSPKCTVDIARRREQCTWGRPSCATTADADDMWDPRDTRKFRTIPVISDKDLLSCAARFGDDPSDVYFGKNPKATTFDAVAVEDAKPARVTLHMRAKDTTPALATKADAWQAADHWEIWLARAGDATVAWRSDKPGYCAALAKELVQLIVAPHADGTLELANGAPKSKGSIAGATARPGKDGEVVVELSGTLAQWASDGAITVSYSDSLDGKKQDTLIGSSRVVWGEPDSLGRLGRDTLCHPTKAEPPMSLPWP